MRSGVEDELGTLCRECGLCCDGSLFGRVPLAPEERPGARRSRLHLSPRGDAFEQPCSALSTVGAQHTCAIYSDRPRACRAFTCRLHDRHRREGGPLEARLASVRRVRALLALVETATDGEVRRDVLAELTRRMDEDFARAPPSLPEGRDGLDP